MQVGPVSGCEINC